MFIFCLLFTSWLLIFIQNRVFHFDFIVYHLGLQHIYQPLDIATNKSKG